MTYPFVSSSISLDTLELLDDERFRQKTKFAKFPLASLDAAIRIMGEEFGEICKAANQRKPGYARIEIVQLAAICIAFLDGDLHDGDI